MNGSNCRSHFVRHILVTFMEGYSEGGFEDVE